jgi:hypothetical protein
LNFLRKRFALRYRIILNSKIYLFKKNSIKIIFIIMFSFSICHALFKKIILTFFKKTIPIKKNITNKI